MPQAPAQGPWRAGTEPGSCTALCALSERVGRGVWPGISCICRHHSTSLHLSVWGPQMVPPGMPPPPPFLSFPGTQGGSGSTAAGQVRAYRPPLAGLPPQRGPLSPACKARAGHWHPLVAARAGAGAAWDLMPSVTAGVPGSPHHPHLRPVQPVTAAVTSDSRRGLRDTGGNQRARA